MPVARNYGLSWIDNDALFEVSRKAFAKSFQKANAPFDPEESKNAIDPFNALLLMGATGRGYQAWVQSERERQFGKTLQNATGNWHQTVLGLAPRWKNKGSNGGVFDIESTEPVLGFGSEPYMSVHVIAEVKNKYNTIKASDERETHRKLEDQAKSRGKDTVAYLIQIIPDKKQRYNKPWVPSGARESNRVYVMDGHTAYDLVFEYPDALKELYLALPHIINDVLVAEGFSATDLSADAEEISALFGATFGR
ncbi:MAG: Eco47II family restriction endonuclease [Rothia sp. (in: high G+C Gram-positive bacteria)]|uniref:Eco47II family restriction endonuclease n=1 Tax=Rothia sp. (in: high G+C Gram-positive bacteria) TaxID=1885016 RepID=UPI0026E006EB|nr:Eco47II family restriction endonuclease [Rothia sp. (in: high G+C Gram-positive bacteria)]MDO5750361.1 Eco47II family restriction endonuclease [Rothia sp. (in: high G+C Gram-positive bacteria)]